MKHEFSYYLSWSLTICASLVGMFVILFSNHKRVEWNDTFEDKLVEQDIELISPNIYRDVHGFFWFSDETENLNGPYNTSLDANLALQKYIEYLSPEKDSPSTSG